MANLTANSNGNFTAAATWSLIDSTSFGSGETGPTNPTAAFTTSATFTPGAITIDGIGIRVGTRNGTTGTFSVRLFNSTLAAAVAGTTVTINMTDVPNVNGASASTGGGWMFMKFSASVTLLAATLYAVQAMTSTTNQILLYRNSATANDWSRYLRTTTTQAPAAADDLTIDGEYVSAGVNSVRTVTMNNTATTTFGSAGATVTSIGMHISANGVLTWGTSASTSYYLKLAGYLTVYGGGTYNCGTSGTNMPSTSTASLEFANTSNVQFGLEARANSTINMYGNSITVSALLAADAAAAATSLTTNVSTAWKNGDVIALASTSRNAQAEAESKALTADASGTTLTITALSSGHIGTSPVQADLINLTRNVKVFGTSTTNQAYINIANAVAASVTGSMTLQYVEIYNMGSATALKRGIDMAAVNNTVSINHCSIHDFTVASSLGFNTTAATNGFTFDSNVFYNMANQAMTMGITAAPSTYTVSNCIAIKNVANSLFNFTAMRSGATVSNLTANAATTSGVIVSDSTLSIATVATIKSYGNVVRGLDLSNSTGLDTTAPPNFTSVTCFRNQDTGVKLNNTFNLNLTTGTLFGNGGVANTGNMGFGADNAGIFITSYTFDAGTTVTCPIGLAFSSDSNKVIFGNCTFGSTTTHATADFSVTAANNFVDLVFRDCLLSSATKVSLGAANANIINGSEIRFAMFQQTTGNHITYKRMGTIQQDTVIFNNASPSQKLTPNSATSKLESGKKRVAVPINQTATIVVFVRKSVAGDGAAYNGNQPRLVVKRNYANGTTSDTVLATASAAAGSWEKLTATTSAITDDAAFELVVDCDGTTGWVNVDDWRAY